MATFEEIRQGADSRALVRKIQRAVAFIAPKTIDLPDSLFAASPATGLVDLKAAGWLPLGLVTPDGYTFSGERETEDIDALGYASPVRTDTTRVPRSVSVTLLESGRKHVEELKRGVDLTGITQDATTGEVVFDEPELPIDREYRLIVVGQDGPADEEWVMGKAYGAVKISNAGEETWGQEGAVQSEITLNVFTDDEIGTPVRHFMGGTGAVKHKDVLGYAQGV